MNNKVLAVAIGGGVYWALNTYNSQRLYGDDGQLRFGPRTVEIITALIALVVYYYGDFLKRMLPTGNFQGMSAPRSAFGVPSSIDASSMGGMFQGQAGVAGNVNFAQTFD
jgi:hypothetical protein